MAKLLFPIKTASELSGVSEHLIRAWERRYSFIEPSRTKNGRRQYTFEQIEILKYVRFLLQNGHTIGSLARIKNRDLKKLALDSGYQVAPLQLAIEKTRSYRLDLKKFNLIEIDRELSRARMSLPLNEFVIQVMGPFLLELGRLYGSGDISITQEHMVSHLVRNHLGELLSRIQTFSNWNERRKTPKFVFTTQEGNIHEFGILLSALLVGSKQLSFQYLGPNLPALEIVKFCKETAAEVLVLGSTMLPPKSTKQSFKSFIEELDRALPKSMQIWIGGYCPFNVLDIPTARVLKRVDSLQEFDQLLES